MYESGCWVNRGNVRVLNRAKQSHYFSQIVNNKPNNKPICNTKSPTSLSHLHPFDLAGQHLIAVALESVSFILIGKR